MAPHTQNEAPATVQAVKVLPYKHEASLFWCCVYMAVNMWLILLLITLGMIVPIMGVVWALSLFAQSRMVAWLKGNAVKVTATQLPDLHAHYTYCLARLGMDKSAPEFYLLQSDGSRNAFAMLFLRRNYVVLMSDIADALEENPNALRFYIGHELGHVHRKHLSRHWWLWPGLIMSFLASAYSRAREYTCDRYGFACCLNLEDAQRAMTVLVAGTRRWRDLNLAEFQSQVKETGGFWMAVNELTADYPWLCKRMAHLANRNATFPRRHWLAWVVAVFSPRLGYGGALLGAIYLGLFVGLIVFVALSVSGGGDWFADYWDWVVGVYNSVFEEPVTPGLAEDDA